MFTLMSKYRREVGFHNSIMYIYILHTKRYLYGYICTLKRVIKYSPIFYYRLNSCGTLLHGYYMAAQGYLFNAKTSLVTYSHYNYTKETFYYLRFF